jgi:hypothetical protein
MTDVREASLAEYIHNLPAQHIARKEYDELCANLVKAEKDLAFHRSESLVISDKLVKAEKDLAFSKELSDTHEQAWIAASNDYAKCIELLDAVYRLMISKGIEDKCLDDIEVLLQQEARACDTYRSALERAENERLPVYVRTALKKAVAMQERCKELETIIDAQVAFDMGVAHGTVTP